MASFVGKIVGGAVSSFVMGNLARAYVFQPELPQEGLLHGTDASRFPYKEGEEFTVSSKLYVTKSEERAENFAKMGFSVHRHFSVEGCKQPIKVRIGVVENHTKLSCNWVRGWETWGPRNMLPGADLFVPSGTKVKVLEVTRLKPLPNETLEKYESLASDPFGSVC